MSPDFGPHIFFISNVFAVKIPKDFRDKTLQNNLNNEKKKIQEAPTKKNNKSLLKTVSFFLVL